MDSLNPMNPERAERIVERFDVAGTDEVLILTFRRRDVYELAARLDAGGRDTARLLATHAHKAVVA